VTDRHKQTVQTYEIKHAHKTTQRKQTDRISNRLHSMHSAQPQEN